MRHTSKPGRPLLAEWAAPSMRAGMATNIEELAESERIKELIRQLNVALQQCHKLLGVYERPADQSTHDKDPE